MNSTVAIHKMAEHLTAACGADSFDLAVSWSNVSCAACRAELAKTEILGDVKDGAVPADVSSFSELHDHVDANEYGGLCDDRLLDGDDGFPEWVTDMANETQSLVDQWIKDGGLR